MMISSQADRRPIGNRHQYLISSNRISILHNDHDDIEYKAHVDDHDHDVDANEDAGQQQTVAARQQSDQ